MLGVSSGRIEGCQTFCEVESLVCDVRAATHSPLSALYGCTILETASDPRFDLTCRFGPPDATPRNVVDSSSGPSPPPWPATRQPLRPLDDDRSDEGERQVLVRDVEGDW